jgi:hypothetical protein
MVSSQKRVILRKFSRDWVPGFMPSRNFLHAGNVELLDTDGKVLAIPLAEIKLIAFVREFATAGAADPERIGRRSFSGRPRAAGVMLRLRFRDNDALEGLAANDLSLIENAGLLLTPPDTRGNTQRIYIPHLALAELEVLSVIRTPVSRKAADLQRTLFSQPTPAGTRPN